jgi:hypothetical protein
VNATLREDAHPIIRKLESIFRLSDDEKAAVMDLPLQITAIKADQDVVREGDGPSKGASLTALDWDGLKHRVTST